MSDSKLKPCPRCGKDYRQTIYEQANEDGYGMTYIQCDKCGVRTCNCSEEEDAINQWNKGEVSNARRKTAKGKGRRDALEPCPRCGKKYRQIIYTDDIGFLPDTYIQCGKCGVETCVCQGVEEAIEEWNLGGVNDARTIIVESKEKKEPFKRVVPCPECGLKQDVGYEQVGDKHWFTCFSCDVRGDTGTNKDDAREKWNTYALKG